jgi:arsenate reductase-like glutaredoxin family protein
MSELVENEEASMPWRIKKAPDDSIYGPVDVETLKEWANSAQIAPEDMVDESDENWRAAPEIDFLEMVWLVKLPGGETYGPTTVGTLREFINESLVTEKTLVTHRKTRQSLPLTALVAAVDFEKKRASRRPPKEANKSTASLAVEMAKDQHIRQLEEDLKELRREHETLTHKYRQLTLQMQESTKSIKGTTIIKPPRIVGRPGTART